MNNVWNYHDKKMRDLKRVYNRISKQTQNNLQDIFDSYKIDFEHLYNIADNKTLSRVKIKIEEWKDKGLLTGYFGMLANSIYKRTRVKNSEILELLIYGAYIEEQNKLEETELNIFNDVANYYYQEGQKEVNQTLPKKKRKLVSVIPDAIFLALLDMQNEKGYVWKQYVEAIIKYNADQIYRQMLINIQQNKENNIDDSVYQNIITKQQNAKLSINQDKISGAVDNELIGLNNLAKVEGIKSIAEDDNSQVEFWAVTDENSTDMCQSMNGMKFYINKENSFDRYWGETKKELKLVRVKIKGLVPGINLPPIAHHTHYCRSTIRYVPPSIKRENDISEDENILEIFNYNNFIKTDITKQKEQLIKTAFKNDIIKNIALKNDIENIYIYGKKSKHKANKIYLNANWKNRNQDSKNRTIRHEVGHAIDYKYNYISSKGEMATALEIDKKNILKHQIEINQKLNNKELENYAELSDIIGGLTNNKIRGKYYHRNEYWSRKNALEKETFADLFSIAGGNDIKYLEIINTYLPNTLKAFNSLIRRIK